MSSPETNFFLEPEVEPSVVFERITALRQYIIHYLRRIPGEAKTANEMARILGIHHSHRLALRLVLDMLARDQNIEIVHVEEYQNDEIRWYGFPSEKKSENKHGS